MPSIFTPTLDGTFDPRVVWRDEHCVVLHALEPLRAGHVIVVPKDEIDHWLDLPPDLAAHLLSVAQLVGRAVQDAFHPTKVGLMIAGLKVRHVHLHLIPIDQVRDILAAGPQPVDSIAAACLIRDRLRELGVSQVAEG